MLDQCACVWMQLRAVHALLNADVIGGTSHQYMTRRLDQPQICVNSDCKLRKCTIETDQTGMQRASANKNHDREALALSQVNHCAAMGALTVALCIMES